MKKVIIVVICIVLIMATCTVVKYSTGVEITNKHEPKKDINILGSKIENDSVN